MADIFDTLKKHTDRVNSSASKSKKVKREKTRPWHDFTVTASETLLDEQKATLKSVSKEATKDTTPPYKTDLKAFSETQEIRKQSDNDSETDVYVNKSVYVNSAETDSLKTVELNKDFNKIVNNTETNVYVNKSDFVNNTETISRLDVKSESYVLKTDSLLLNNKETNVYVNNTETSSSKEISNNIYSKISKANTETSVYVNSAETDVYVNNTESISKQNVNNSVTTSKQQGNDAQTISKRNDNNTTLNKKTNTETVRKQSTPAELVYSLPRSEEKILKFIVELCLNSASLTTPKLTYRLISNATQITEKSCKTLIGRLKNKNIMHLESYTKGPGSYSIFSISQEVYNNFLYISGKSVLFDMRKQNVNNAETQSPLITDTTLSSKLVSNLINTNNTMKSKIYEFTTEDLNLDELRILGVTGKAVGDSIRNLTKFLESNPDISPLSKDDFQDFINKFVEYANSTSGKSMKSKSAIFIHEVQKFQKEGTCSTIDWSNDKDIEIYEQFVNEQEDKKKRKAEMLEKAIEYSFSIWRDEHSKETLLSLVPESQFSKYGNPGYELELKKYYRDNIWEIRKTQF